MEVGGEAEAVARARAYEAAGVDPIFLVGVTNRAQLDAVAGSVSIPLGSAPVELAERDYLAARGVRVALRGHLPIAAAIAAVHATLKRLWEGIEPSQIGGISSEELMKQVTRDADYERWIAEFLT
jgi:carboxyvinyl-carboxyphosphonate phosphorylmutase